MLSLPDLLLIGGSALLIFGPERLPSIAREAGRIIGEFRAASQSLLLEPPPRVEPPPAVKRSESEVEQTP